MPRFRHRPLIGFAGVALLCPAPLLAQDAPIAAPAEASAQGDVSVTIYNNDLALIQDVRTLDIAAGRSRIEFPDVSSRIRPETLSFVAAGAAIAEQNFDFDLLSPTSPMQKAIGQTITLIRTNPATGAETRERATVLSTVGGVVVRLGDHIEVLRDDGLPVRALFDRVPPNLRARPTLSVTVQSDRAGSRPASIRYLTPGLGWAADYVALYDETRGVIDMQGWVTLTNQTGTSFVNANTVLVAGSPMVTSGDPYARPYQYNQPRPQSGMVRAGTERTNRDQLGDYYLYPIAGRTTIANAQTKQVAFLDVAGVAAHKVYGRTIDWMQNDAAPVNVASQIAFSTSRAGGLGDALPAGTVRFYQRDSKGTPQFIGENMIGHTPTGSDMLLTTGTAFDVFVQANVVKREEITSAQWETTARYRVVRNGVTVRQVEVDQHKTFYRTTLHYKLTNAKPQPVTVSLVQGGLDRGWWSQDYRVVSETVTGEQVNADQRKWEVPVPANGAADLTVVFDSRY